MDIIRIIRIIMYEGEREWVERTINGSITGTKTPDFGKPYNKISVITLGNFPEIMNGITKETKND